MRLGEAKTPDGMRLYAIGDVHGCDDLLAEAHGKIAADLAARPAADHRIIHVGDYVDRGPDSAGGDRAAGRLSRDRPRVICLRGNHDELLLGFLADPVGGGADFLANGGDGDACAPTASRRPVAGSAAIRRPRPRQLAAAHAGRRTAPSSRPAALRALRRLLLLPRRHPAGRSARPPGSARTSSGSARSSSSSDARPRRGRRPRPHAGAPSPRSCPTASTSTPARSSAGR